MNAHLDKNKCGSGKIIADVKNECESEKMNADLEK